MSVSQTIAGGGVLGAFLLAVISPLFPEPPVVQVHSLVFDGETVLQDRTISGDEDRMPVFWMANVINVNTGLAIHKCSGDGGFPYPVGRDLVTMDLPHWTGREGCTPEAIGPGEYVLQATWTWSGGQTSAESEPFTIP